MSLWFLQAATPDLGLLKTATLVIMTRVILPIPAVTSLLLS